MSADRQRLKSAIRRIALTPEERRAFLGEGQNKGGKASSAGVGTSEAEESRLCCDGATSASANPGTGERDPDADGAGQDGLNSSDPANLNSGDGTLSGVTDCATGEPICFDGAGFIPPDGWDDQNEPPPVDDYQEGRYYIVTYNISGTNSTEYVQACSQALAIADSICPGYQPNCPTSGGLSPPCSDVLSFGISDKYCESEYNSVCDEEPPRKDAWPTDGCVNLAVKSGTIVGSKYDPENDGSYSAPRDSIDLCSGGDQISLSPAANGGWKTINSTTNNGYLYDSSGKQIAHIDGNEYSDPSI